MPTIVANVDPANAPSRRLADFGIVELNLDFAKGSETDPVTGQPVELVWVKGSGGDLGTLTESGLAVLRLDQIGRAHV